MAFGDFYQTMTSLVSRATKRLSHLGPAARRSAAAATAPVLSRGASIFPFLGGEKRRRRRRRTDGEDGVWKRTIIMGEKCEPLDFSGAIYYDGEGKRVADLPVKSPRRSPFPSFGFYPVVARSDKKTLV